MNPPAHPYQTGAPFNIRMRRFSKSIVIAERRPGADAQCWSLSLLRLRANGTAANSAINEAWLGRRRASPSSRQTASGAWRLLNEVLRARAEAGGLRDARRLAWRAARSPLTTLTWLSTLDQLRMIAGVKQIPFDLARKPGRAFLHRTLSYSTKVRVLTEHYTQLLAVLGRGYTGLVLRGERLTLAEFSGRSGVAYQLLLARNHDCRREGELHVTLAQADSGRQLASLSFVVGSLSPGEPRSLWIGGLQGCQGEDSRALTVSVTRDIWGLRPKDLLVHAAYGLAELLEARTVAAISNAGHVIPPACPGDIGRHADYDSFWRELGSASTPGGFFVLPRVRPRRSEADVPSTKRKAWRARYELIDRICANLRRLGDQGDRCARSLDPLQPPWSRKSWG